MKVFTTYLRENGYAENTVSSYEFAISQLIDKASPLTNQSLLGHKEWLVSSFAPKTANNRIGAINAYLDFSLSLMGCDSRGCGFSKNRFSTTSSAISNIHR